MTGPQKLRDTSIVDNLNKVDWNVCHNRWWTLILPDSDLKILRVHNEGLCFMLSLFLYVGLTLIRIMCYATINTLIDCDQWCVYILVTHDWRIVGIDTWSTCNKQWILNTISPFWTKYIIIAATHLKKSVQNRVWILSFKDGTHFNNVCE